MTTIIRKTKSGGSGMQGLILDVRAATNPNPNVGPMLFSVVDNTQELAATAGNYDPNTGIYTVPAGGHKNVRILTGITIFSTGNGIYSSVRIMVNGYQKAESISTIATATYRHVAEANIKNLVAGDQIKIVCMSGNNQASGYQMSDFMQIFATS
ncbi:MAG: hypothetical protein NVS3B3_21430 [Aquirhabdus sp.]